jgi:hypothetical protein
MPVSEFGNHEDHGVDQRVEVFSYFMDPDQSDENSSTKSGVNYTTSAGIPVLEEPGSPIYSPQMSPESPIPFPTLNVTPVNLSGQESAESYSAESDPEENSRHLENKARALSGSIRYLTEQLREVRGQIQEALHPRTTPESSDSDKRIHNLEESHHCAANHKFQECLKKRTRDEEGSTHHMSRKSRRRERDRRRNGI